MTETLLFVAAPFLPEHQPALGMSSLISVLATRGINADAMYLNIDYAELIGEDLYRFISVANPPSFQIGEMVFATALWGIGNVDTSGYISRLRQEWEHPAYLERRPDNFDKLLRGLEILQREAPAIVEGWAREVLMREPRLVGFTTTFQQNVASLAIAKTLRRSVIPDKLAIVFGGANCEGDMGCALARNFSFIDHVVSGEGEEVILDIVDYYYCPTGLSRPSKPPRYILGHTVSDLNLLPIPDFDAYFAQVRGTRFEASANLAAESSRGCWWGMKSHCTFCGLNGQTMRYRSKDASKFAGELRALSTRYGPDYFAVADNILDMDYIQSLFPLLVEEGDKFRLFYEVKANLRKEQLEALAAGGIVRLQPGIESLSTSILRLMGKGTTFLQNVQLLKWCDEFRIEVAWNLLFGFPGEEPTEYIWMASVIPTLVHLQPPIGSGQVRLDRFSPYWKRPRDFQLSNIRQFWSYDYIYSQLTADERAHLAYYFEFDHPKVNASEFYCSGVLQALDRWREYETRPVLERSRNGGVLCVRDTRGVNDEINFDISYLEDRLLTLFDARRSRASCYDSLLRSYGEGISIAEFDRVMETFRMRKWIAEEGQQALSLVVDRAEFSRVVGRRAAYLLNSLGVGESPSLKMEQELTA